MSYTTVDGYWSRREYSRISDADACSHTVRGGCPTREYIVGRTTSRHSTWYPCPLLTKAEHPKRHQTGPRRGDTYVGGGNCLLRYPPYHMFEKPFYSRTDPMYSAPGHPPVPDARSFTQVRSAPAVGVPK